MNLILLIGGGAEVLADSASIPSTYSSGSIYNASILIDNDYTLEPETQIYRERVTTMVNYARLHIPNYNTITTYPNDIQYNPNTSNCKYWASAFANMENLTDKVEDVMDRFDFSNCEDADRIFYSCESLTGSIPNFPAKLKSLRYGFDWCKNISGPIPAFPASLNDIDNCFYDCENITYVPTIHENIIYLNYAFLGCKNISNIPNIIGNKLDMVFTFDGCYKMRGTPVLPNGLINAIYTYRECRNLTGPIPQFPNTLKRIASIFWSCSNLSGTIPNLPENLTQVNEAFAYCTSLSSSNIYIFSDEITNATNFTYGCKNEMNIFVHDNTATYNAFYSAMGGTYNDNWGPGYLYTF